MDRSLRIRMILEASDKVTRPLRDMASGSTKAAQALKATRDRLKEIERAQADIGGFRVLKAGLRSTGQDLEAARRRVTQLGRSISEVDKPTRSMTREFAAARAEAKRLEAQHQQETAQLGQLRDRLRAAGVETRALASHERDLRQAAARTNTELAEQQRRLTTAADRARRFADGRDRFSKVQNTATGLAASGTAALGTGVAIAAPVMGSVKAAQDYQSVMSDIAQKANLSRREAGLMGRNLLAAAKAANQMPAEMQAGVDTLAGFGKDPREAVKMMQPIGRAATAYKAQIADLAAAAFAVNDNLKVPVDQTGKVIDVMAAAGKAGAFEMKDMAMYFPSLTAGYQGLGQSGVAAAADLAAALQITRKGAGTSEEAATNLSNVIQKMASPDTIKKFARFGVDLPNALKRAYKEGKTPIEAIAELTNKALGGDLSRLGFLFEDSQVQKGLRPLIQNMEEYRRVRAEAGAASGTTDVDFAERMKDSAERTKQLGVNAAVTSITLGSTLFPIVNAITDRISAFTSRLSDWANRNPGFAKGLMIAAAAMAGLFMILGAIAIAITAVLAPFAALSFTAGLLGVGLLPVIGIALGVIAVIAALGAAAYLIYKNWDGVAGFFMGLWNGVKSIFSMSFGDIVRSIGFFVGYALGALYRFGPAAWNWLTGTLPGLLKRGWDVAWSGFKGALRAAFITLPSMFFDFGAMIIKGLLKGIANAPARLWNAGKSLASSVANGFKAGAQIKSPSRLFAGLGGYLTQGLALGIERGGGAPVDRLRRIIGAMAAATAGTLALPGLANATGVQVEQPRSFASAGARRPGDAPPPPAAGANWSVTITIAQQPDQSATDLAQEVKRELDKLRREEEARSRSSFRDPQDYGSLD